MIYRPHPLIQRYPCIGKSSSKSIMFELQAVTSLCNRLICGSTEDLEVSLSSMLYAPAPATYDAKKGSMEKDKNQLRCRGVPSELPFH
jgi:hypothetical protein